MSKTVSVYCRGCGEKRDWSEDREQHPDSDHDFQPYSEGSKLPLQDSNAIFQKYHPLKSAGWFSFVRVYRDGSAQYGTCYHNGTTAYFARVHAHDLDEIAGHLREAAAAMRGRAGEPQDAADVRAVLRRWRRAVDEAQIGLLPGQFERDVARTFRMLDEIEAALGNPEQSKDSLPTEKEVEEAACAAANRRIEESANDDPAYPHEFRCHVRGFFDGAEWERSRGIKQANRSYTDEEIAQIVSRFCAGPYGWRWRDDIAAAGSEAIHMMRRALEPENY